MNNNMNNTNNNRLTNNANTYNSKYVTPNNTNNNERVRYKYTAFDKSGKQVKGYFDAVRRMDVESFLTAQGYKIAEITPVKINTFTKITAFEGEMRYKDLVFFLAQLSTYIKSGIPLTDSIAMLEKQTINKKRKNLYKRLVYELNSGANFSEALIRQGRVFPKLLINMVKTSELTGNLTEALDDMQNYYKTADTNRKQIISALTYPSVVLVVAMGVLTFLLIYIIPKFQGIFDQLGADLPGITVFLINTSNFVQNNILKIVLAIIAIGIILYVMYNNIQKFRYYVQWLLMHIPVIKDVLIYNEVTMFTKTFSSLIRHDVFITDSVEILGKITNNEIFKDIIKEAVNNLSAGAGLSPAFENKWAFPRIAYEMLVTGEKTGRLGQMMENVATYFEEEQKNLVQRLKSLIEPVMIVLLAIIVGVVLMAIFIPMFSMYKNVL